MMLWENFDSLVWLLCRRSPTTGGTNPSYSLKCPISYFASGVSWHQSTTQTSYKKTHHHHKNISKKQQHTKNYNLTQPLTNALYKNRLKLNNPPLPFRFPTIYCTHSLGTLLSSTTFNTLMILVLPGVLSTTPEVTTTGSPRCAIPNLTPHIMALWMMASVPSMLSTRSG